MPQAFDYLLDAIAPYTKSSRERMTAMVKACQQIDADQIKGDVVECGVWRGGNIMLARLLCPDRVCWLFDTFQGMANPSKWDVTHKGTIVHVGKTAASIDEVLANFRNEDIDTSKLVFVAGPVEETLRDIDEYKFPKQIALLRLDTDWYHSTKIELEVLWPRLVRGGILIIDDYGHWLGARKAVDEYFGGVLSFQRIDYTAVMMVKNA